MRILLAIITSIGLIFSGTSLARPVIAAQKPATIVAVIDAGAHGAEVATVIRAAFQSDTTSPSELSIMQVAAADRSGSFKPKSISDAIRYAVDHGAHIINVSLGGSNEYFSTTFNDAIQYAHDHDVLLIASAGNAISIHDSGLDLSLAKISPVCNDLDDNMVLGVGAAQSDGSLALWSNVGRCVDIFAPGSFTQAGTIDEGGSLQGTSFASAYVSGIAAHIHAAYPTIGGKAMQHRIMTNRKKPHGIAFIDPARSLSHIFSNDEKRKAAPGIASRRVISATVVAPKPKALVAKKVVPVQKKIVPKKTLKKAVSTVTKKR